MINISAFLPKYPEIQDVFDLYDDDNFNNIIFKKKEFNDIQLEEKQPSVPEKDTEFYNHQLIISRFLSAYTLYDELLLFHSPGTGKTCTSLGVVETIIYNNDSLFDTIKKALIIVPNSDLIKRFEYDLIYTCGGGKYTAPLPDDEEMMIYRENNTESNRDIRKKDVQIRKSRKLISKFYKFTTHATFYKNVLSRLDTFTDKIIDDFSNTVIIIDEAHRISNANEQIYNAYHKFLHIIQNRKILLLTGTPMKNTSAEIVPIMNLILPYEKQITDEVKTELFDSDGNIKNNIDKIYPYFIGRVSYLKSKVDIPYQFNGSDVGINFPLYVSYMSPYQKQVYTTVISSELLNNEAFYHDSLQSALFTFPDGLYGSRGFNKYVSQKQNKMFFQSFIRRGRNDRETLDSIRRYSSKYAAAIQTIINRKDQNCFVFTSSILEGGAVMFGLCLELFGYSRVNSRTDVRGKRLRYAILADEVGTNTNSILSSFNMPSNSNGDFIQVLIGGRKVEEGVTMKSIQQIHILTPRWNMSSLDQVLARGIRIGSHNFLPPNTLVNIYLHVSESPGKEPSVDKRLYEIAHSKDKSIKSIEYLMKTSAMDCSLTYNRNKLSSKYDKKRECDYNDCLYRCKGVNMDSMDGQNIDKDTYQIFFTYEFRNELVQSLQDLFREKTFIPVSELLDMFKSKVSLYQLFYVLNDITTLSIPFTDRFGFQAYLSEYNNILFLSNHPTSQSVYDIFYTEYPPIREYSEYKDVSDMSISDTDYINSVIEQIISLSISEKKERIRKLPFVAQEYFVENAIKNRQSDNELVQWVLDTYASKIIENNDTITTTVLEPIGIERILDKQSGIWITKDIGSETIALDRRQRFIVSKEGIFGYRKRNTFYIVNLSDVEYPTDVNPDTIREFENRRIAKLKTHKGKDCVSHTMKEILSIVSKLNIVPDSNLSLEESNIIVDNFLNRVSGVEKPTTNDMIISYAYWISRRSKSEVCSSLSSFFERLGIMDDFDY